MPFEPKIDVDEDCLICCEPLNHDLNFYPCPCEFQLCSMCWHRIKNDEDNKCPNCREPYGDEPYKWGPLTSEQEVALKELRSKEHSSSSVSKPKPAVAPTIASVELNRDRLAHVRVMQKNLVFVVGLSTQIAQEQVLRRTEYFGKYGKILKVAVNQSTAYAGTQGNSFTLKSKDLGPSASAYVTYNTTDAALKCIQEVNGSYQDGRTLKATLGTTKYCSRFLNGQQCKLTDCMYLHEVAEEEASFTKEDMSKQKHSEYEKSLMDAFIRRQREKHEKEIKTRALAKAQAEADARMKAEMQKQKNRQRAEADKKTKETSPTTSSATPPLAKTSRPNNPPLGGNSSASSTNTTSSSIASSLTSSMTSSTSSTVGIPGQANNHKQKKEKPKTKKEIENEKKRSKIQKQIDESEEEKEEEEVQDAWDSSDEEIEVQNDSKVTTPPPSANQRTGSQTETANQKQEKPHTTPPPPKVTTPNNNVATTNGAKDNKKEKTKSQKQNLETKENHKKSQKHKITNETLVPKTEKGDQKVPESVKPSQAQNEPKPELEKKRKSPPAVTSQLVTSSVTKVNATQVSTTVSKTVSSQSSVRNNDSSSSPNKITSNTLAMSVASVIAERILTPSPPVHNDTRMEDPFRLTMERSREQRNSSEHKPAGSGNGFDPFSLGPSPVGPDRFSPFGSSVQNGVSFDRNGLDRSDANSRPHSNHSSNSGGQTGSISGLGPSFGNSLLSQLEKARPSPPGISSTNQIPSGPPGLGVSQIGSGPQKLDLGNSLPRPQTLQSKSVFDPFDFKKPSVIQGLSNGGPGLVGGGRTGAGLPNGKGPFSLPSPFGPGPTGAGHGEGPGLNLPFPKPSQPMDFRSQPPPPGLGHLSERAKNDLDWLPDHSFSRFRQNDFDQRSRNHFPKSNSDPFRGFHNGFGGMENGIGRPKRQEPKEDDLGFDPSQFALDQLDLTRNKLNDMNLNPRQPNKPRNEHWNQPNSFNSGYGQSNHSNLFPNFGLRGGQPTHSHGPRDPPTQPLGDLRNSQDMLRRLLPNVNVSFNNESNMDNFGRNSYSQGKSAQSSAGAHAQSAAAQAVVLAQQQAAAQLQAAQMQGPRSPAAQQRPTKGQINSLLAKQQQVRNPPPGFGQYQPDTPANGPHLPSNLLDFD